MSIFRDFTTRSNALSILFQMTITMRVKRHITEDQLVYSIEDTTNIRKCSLLILIAHILDKCSMNYFQRVVTIRYNALTDCLKDNPSKWVFTKFTLRNRLLEIIILYSLLRDQMESANHPVCLIIHFGLQARKFNMHTNVDILKCIWFREWYLEARADPLLNLLRNITQRDANSKQIKTMLLKAAKSTLMPTVCNCFVRICLTHSMANSGHQTNEN